MTDKITAEQAVTERPRVHLPRRREFVLAALLLGILVIAAWASVTFALVEPDPACAPCHGGSRVTDAHAGIVACYGCHAAPSDASRAARLVQDGIYALKGVPKARSETVIDSRTCKSCHWQVLESEVSSSGIRMNHRTCLRAKDECTDCHSDAGHGVISADRAVSMDRCSGCHDGVVAPKKCDTCHFGTPTRTDALNQWAVTHGKNRHQTHGMGDLKTCSICHEPQDCSKCHLPVPHPEDWPRIHGGQSLALGEKTCLRCHVRELCDGCHIVKMPHPAGWLPDHSSAVPKSEVERQCKSCHSIGDCRECHLKHIHPGLSISPVEGG